MCVCVFVCVCSQIYIKRKSSFCIYVELSNKERRERRGSGNLSGEQACACGAQGK
jgi:hypothetical protein